MPSEYWEYAPPLSAPPSIWTEPGNHLEAFGPPGALLGIATCGIVASTARRCGLWQRSVLNWPGILFAAFATWLPFALGGLIVVEMLYSRNGEGPFFLRTVFLADQNLMHTLFVAVAFIGISLRLFAPASPAIAESHGPRRVRAELTRDPVLMAGVVVLGLILIAALVGEYLSPHDYRELSREGRNETPSWSHWFGTNNFGQDVLTRVIAGMRDLVKVSGVATVIGFACGAAVTTSVVRMLPRWHPAVYMAFSALTGVPAIWFALVMAFVFAYDPDRDIVGLAIIAFVLSATELHTITRSISTTERRSLRENAARHAPGAIAVFCEVLAALILVQSTTEFLGFGNLPPYGSLGDAIAEGLHRLPWRIHLIAFPAAALVLILLSLHIVAQRLRLHAGGFPSGAAPAALDGEPTSVH